MSALIGDAEMPGTCGELVQGIVEGVAFHVSCPIDIFSHAEIRLLPQGGLVLPDDCPKAVLATHRTLEALGRPCLGFALSLSSPLPRSKGMASSTADIAAAILATSRALGITIGPKEIAGIALGIEPTDGSLFPGIALFDHREGKLCECLGPPPPVDIVALDFGGEVDTISFNRQDRSALLKRLEPRTKEALEHVRGGVALGDPLLLGRGATLSARANQEVLFKPQLEAVIALAGEVGAVGVNVGHSGTVIGVLLERRRGDSEAAHSFLCRRLPDLERSYLCSLIGGGPPDVTVEWEPWKPSFSSPFS